MSGQSNPGGGDAPKTAGITPCACHGRVGECPDQRAARLAMSAGLRRVELAAALAERDEARAERDEALAATTRLADGRDACLDDARGLNNAWRDRNAETKAERDQARDVAVALEQQLAEVLRVVREYVRGRPGDRTLDALCRVAADDQGTEATP